MRNYRAYICEPKNGKYLASELNGNCVFTEEFDKRLCFFDEAEAESVLDFLNDTQPECYVLVVEDSDVLTAIRQILNSDNANEKCVRFVDAFLDSLTTDNEPYSKKGKSMLRAISNNSLDDFLIAACGWSAESLLKKACLLHDADGTFHDEIVEGRFVTVWDNESTEISTSCKINMATFEVFDIEKADENISNSVVTLDAEYVEFDDVRFPVYQKDEISKDDLTSFWYEW